jgi:hypothetical protein
MEYGLLSRRQFRGGSHTSMGRKLAVGTMFEELSKLGL